MSKRLAALVLAFVAVSAWVPGVAGASSQSDRSTSPLPTRAVVSVRWNRTLRAVDPMSYGVDCPSCFNPAWTHNATLLRSLAIITDGGKPLIRLHGWGMITQGSPQCWLSADGTWNAPKIASALVPLIHARYKLMIDIPAGPGGEKDPLHPAEMARLASSLVKIVNVKDHFGVEYWELPNEREHILNATQMAAMFLRAEEAMKKIDPSIKVGGPATEDINVPYLSDFVRAVFPHIDFVTAHTYGGDGTQPDAVSYRSALNAVTNVALLRESLAAITHGKCLPIFVDEYNIGWNYTPNIANNQGAVYFSIMQTGVVEAGGDVTDVWDFSPVHNMSIVARDGQLYPSAHLFALMNRYFYGDEVTATSSLFPAIRAYAVKLSTRHSLLLTNLSKAPSHVVLKFHGWRPRELQEYQISAAGFRDVEISGQSTVLRHKVTLPGRSVTILVH